MSSRELCTILGDVIRRQRCAEITVEYSCGHSVQADVQMAPFLADKREPRAAARSLRLSCKRGGLPRGDDGIFRIEVPGGPCASCGRGSRAGLLCGGVRMDLVSAREASENPIPVGIGARQFAQWVQTDGSCAQSIQLTSCTGGLSWYSFFTTPGTSGPLLLALAVWLVGCVVYGFCAAPQMSMVSPEVFYQQVQDQIGNIPVPKRSPHYSHYRQYYLQQYQQHLSQYSSLEAQWAQNKVPIFQWGAFFQGLGFGTWLFAAMLAFCEFQYGTITAWMEAAEEWWSEYRRRPQTAPRDPLADDAAQESFLSDLMGAGPRCRGAAPPPAEAAKEAAKRAEGPRHRKGSGPTPQDKQLLSKPTAAVDQRPRQPQQKLPAERQRAEAPVPEGKEAAGSRGGRRPGGEGCSRADLLTPEVEVEPAVEPEPSLPSSSAEAIFGDTALEQAASEEADEELGEEADEEEGELNEDAEEHPDEAQEEPREEAQAGAEVLGAGQEADRGAHVAWTDPEPVTQANAAGGTNSASTAAQEVDSELARLRQAARTVGSGLRRATGALSGHLQEARGAKGGAVPAEELSRLLAELEGLQGQLDGALCQDAAPSHDALGAAAPREPEAERWSLVAARRAGRPTRAAQPPTPPSQKLAGPGGGRGGAAPKPALAASRPAGPAARKLSAASGAAADSPSWAAVVAAPTRAAEPCSWDPAGLSGARGAEEEEDFRPREMRAEAPEFVPDFADCVYMPSDDCPVGATVLVPCVLPADGFAALSGGVLPQVDGAALPPGHVLVLAPPGPADGVPVMMAPAGLPLADFPGFEGVEVPGGEAQQRFAEGDWGSEED
ncbi:unnamed protein product [Prorocentrum cordatum]|uniref:Uncharacterized protein n=1 Tax=Prorocentrum cordatum TaxID=2364126 RepID=A0ABN9QW62_9DINO|nr:unnamed protein product [Polarella glacialis]